MNRFVFMRDVGIFKCIPEFSGIVIYCITGGYIFDDNIYNHHHQVIQVLQDAIVN